jgi:hypothetical protein
LEAHLPSALPSHCWRGGKEGGIEAGKGKLELCVEHQKSEHQQKETQQDTDVVSERTKVVGRMKDTPPSPSYLELDVVGKEFHVALLGDVLAAKKILRERASLVRHRARPGQVGVRGGEALLVVQLLVGGGGGQQVLGQAGLGGVGHRKRGEQAQGGAHQRLLGLHGLGGLGGGAAGLREGEGRRGEEMWVRGDEKNWLQ